LLLLLLCSVVPIQQPLLDVATCLPCSMMLGLQKCFCSWFSAAAYHSLILLLHAIGIWRGFNYFSVQVGACSSVPVLMFYGL
jgi:hypothetical protein